MLRTLAIVVAFALAASSADAAACRDDKGKFIKCPATPAPAMATTTTKATAAPAGTDAAGGAPVCKKGKPCGHSCIAKDKVCHK